MTIKNTLATLFFTCFLTPLFAHEGENLWTTGKINVVLGVVLIILIGIILFLFVLERRINALEKMIQKN